MKRTIKWIVGVVLAALLVVGLVILRNETSILIDQYLRDYVPEQSNGLYTMDFSDLDLNLLNGKVHLTDLKFEVVPERMAELSAEENMFYNLSVKKATVNVDRFWTIYTQKDLSIEEIIIDDPIVEIIRTGDAPNGLSRGSGDLYLFIADLLHEFSIDELNVSSAQLKYKEDSKEGLRVFRIPDLSFSLEGILIDSASASDKNKIFYTDDLEILVKDQAFELSDSIHKLHFGAFHLNTNSSEIRIEEMAIGPMEGVDLDEVSRFHNIYNNHVPLIMLKGTDFQKAYSENVLHIEKVEIQEPTYSGTNKVMSTEKPEDRKPENSLADLLLSVFDELHVDSFIVKSGSMDLSLRKGEQMLVNEVDFRVSQLHIDTATRRLNRWEIDYEDIEFHLRGQHLFTTKTDDIELQDLRISSRDSSLELRNVQLSSTLYDEFEEITSERIALKGLEVRRLIEERHLEADSLLIVKPRIELFEIGSGSNNSNAAEADPYASIAPYLNAIAIDDLVIQEAFVQIADGRRAHYNIGQLDVHLVDMRIDSNMAERNDILFSRRMNFDLRNIDIALKEWAHQVTMDRISLSGSKGTFQVHNARTRHLPGTGTTANTTYDIEVPLLSAWGFDLDRMIKKKEVRLSSLKLKEADVLINVNGKSRDKNDNAGIGNALSALGVRSMVVERVGFELSKNGTPVFTAKDVFMEAKGFDADPASLARDRLLMKFDSLKYGTNELEYRMNNGDQILSTKRILVDIGTSFGSIEDLEYKTLKRTDDPEIMVRIPLMTSRNFEPYYGQYTRDLDLGEFTIHQPEVVIAGKGKKKKQGKEFNIPDRLPAEGLFGLFDTLQSKRLSVNDASIRFSSGGKDSSSVAIKSADVKLNDLFISTKSSFKKGRDLWTRSIEVDLEGVQGTMPDHTAHINTLRLDTRTERMHLTRFDYHTGTEADTVEIDAHLPMLAVQGFKVHELLVGNELITDDIILEEPRFRIRRSFEQEIADTRQEIEDIVKGEADDIGWSLADLGLAKRKKQKKKGPLLAKELDVSSLGLARIDIGGFKMIGGDVWVQWELEKDRDATEVKNMDLFIKDISAGKELIATSSKPLYVGSLRFRTGALKQPINNGLDELKARSVDVDLTKGTAELQDLSIHPTLSRNAYGRAKGKQVDVLDLDDADVSITGLNAYQLLHGNGLYIDEVIVSNARFNIFKDKRLPLAIKVKPIPSTALSDAKRSIDVRYIELANAYLKYEEISEQGSEPGSVFLTDLNAWISNATNISSRIEADREMLVRGSANLMDEAYLELDMDFDMHFAGQGLFTAEARVGSFDMQTLNEFVANHSFVSFRQGRADTLVMRMAADNDYAVGEMGFFYEDLKVDILKSDEQRQKGKGTLFGGLLANAILKTHNEYKGNSRTHPVYFERDKTRSVINYTVKSLLSGLISTISPAGYKSKIKKVEDPVLLEKMRQKGISQTGHPEQFEE